MVYSPLLVSFFYLPAASREIQHALAVQLNKAIIYGYGRQRLYFLEWEDFLGVTDISISGIKLSGLSQTDGLL